MTLTAEQEAEISSLRERKKHTLRSCSDGMENNLYKVHRVLDHGFVRVIDYMGDDSAIVQAARVSYGQGTKKSRDDSGLINYLMRNWHSTPFEMCEIKLHIKLPIFVARQWIRHRTANVNEYSARYSVLDKEFYIPKKEHLGAQSKKNNQGRENLISPEESERILKIFKEDSKRSYEKYLGMLTNGDKEGLAREIARINLPMNIYTQWYWKTNLHNLFHFLRLRADEHAQYEIRVYAEVIMSIVKDWVPLAYAAFENYRLNSIQISEVAVSCIKKILKGENVNFENSQMSKGEWSEFKKNFLD